MADCILMQLGSNLHWDQTCEYAQVWHGPGKITLGSNLQNLQSQCPKRSRGADYQIVVLGIITADCPRIYLNQLFHFGHLRLYTALYKYT